MLGSRGGGIYEVRGSRCDGRSEKVSKWELGEVKYQEEN